MSRQLETKCIKLRDDNPIPNNTENPLKWENNNTLIGEIGTIKKGL